MRYGYRHEESEIESLQKSIKTKEDLESKLKKITNTDEDSAKKKDTLKKQIKGIDAKMTIYEIKYGSADFKDQILAGLASGISGKGIDETGIGGAAIGRAVVTRLCEPLGESIKKEGSSVWNAIFSAFKSITSPITEPLGLTSPLSTFDIDIIVSSADHLTCSLKAILKAADSLLSNERSMNVRRDISPFLSKKDRGPEEDDDEGNADKIQENSTDVDVVDYLIKNQLLDVVNEMIITTQEYIKKMHNTNIFRLSNKNKRVIRALGLMKTSELRLKNIFQESTSINDLIKEGRFQEIEGVCKTIKHFSNSKKTLLFGASDNKTN
jgi:hypothetical protein